MAVARPRICRVRAGGILLCAVDTDDRAPSLVATTRAWAAATRCRALFVHGCTSRPAEAAPERLAALGVGEDERLLGRGEPSAVIAATVARVRPELLLVASSANGETDLGRVAHASLRASGSALAIIPRGADEALSDRPVVCAVSLGDHDEAAVRFAHAFAGAAGVRLGLRHVLGSRDAVMIAAERARSTVAVSPTRRVGTDDRAEVLAQRLLDITSDAEPAALVIASRPGDPASRALETDAFWSGARCSVVIVRP
jgi:hypothetical protein